MIMPKIITASSLQKQKEVLEDLKKTEKTYKLILKFLEKAKMQRNDAIYKEAEKIFDKKFLKLKHSSLKRALSQREIRKILAKRSKLNKTIDSMKAINKKLTKAVKIADAATKACELFYALKNLVGRNPEDENKDKLTKAREQLLEDYEDMKKLTTVLKSIANKAPFCIGDYMCLVLDVFNNAEGAIMIFKDRAEKLQKETERIKSDNLGKNHASEVQKNTHKGDPGEWIFYPLKTRRKN